MIYSCHLTGASNTVFGMKLVTENCEDLIVSYAADYYKAIIVCNFLHNFEDLAREISRGVE